MCILFYPCQSIESVRNEVNEYVRNKVNEFVRSEVNEKTHCDHHTTNMNIFFLSLSVRRCAKYHCDKHVVKMILESCQLLWSAFHLTGINDWQTRVPENIKIYRVTHKNHPMAIWVRTNPGNFTWLARLSNQLCKEYARRYGRVHSCQSMAKWFLNNVPKCDSTDVAKRETVYSTQCYPRGCTPPPLCMPDHCKSGNLVLSYRKCYRMEKKEFAEWRYSETPYWFR